MGFITGPQAPSKPDLGPAQPPREGARLYDASPSNELNRSVSSALQRDQRFQIDARLMHLVMRLAYGTGEAFAELESLAGSVDTDTKSVMNALDRLEQAKLIKTVGLGLISPRPPGRDDDKVGRYKTRLRRALRSPHLELPYRLAWFAIEKMNRDSEVKLDLYRLCSRFDAGFGELMQALKTNIERNKLLTIDEYEEKYAVIIR
jgi:hypothetical protein